MPEAENLVMMSKWWLWHLLSSWLDFPSLFLSSLYQCLDVYIEGPCQLDEGSQQTTSHVICSKSCRFAGGNDDLLDLTVVAIREEDSAAVLAHGKPSYGNMLMRIPLLILSINRLVVLAHLPNIALCFLAPLSRSRSAFPLQWPSRFSTSGRRRQHTRITGSMRG